MATSCLLCWSIMALLSLSTFGVMLSPFPSYTLNLICVILLSSSCMQRLLLVSELVGLVLLSVQKWDQKINLCCKRDEESVRYSIDFDF